MYPLTVSASWLDICFSVFTSSAGAFFFCSSGSVRLVVAVTFSMAALISPSLICAMFLRPMMFTAAPTPTPMLELVTLALALTFEVVPFSAVTATRSSAVRFTPFLTWARDSLFCTLTTIAPATPTEPSLVSAFWRSLVAFWIAPPFTPLDLFCLAKPAAPPTMPSALSSDFSPSFLPPEALAVALLVRLDTVSAVTVTAFAFTL